MINKTTCGGFTLGGVVFFILSLLLFKQVPPTKNHMDIDSGAYVQAANFLLRDGSFAILRHSPYYGLGYPVLLAGLKKIGGDNIGFIIAVQVLLAWLIMLMIWRIAALLFDRRAAWIAYAFAVTSLGLLVFAQFLLTEILLMLLLSIAVERLLVFFFTQRASALAVAGVALGLSCVVKAVALPFLAPLFVLVVARCWRQEMLKKCATLLVAFAIPYGAYAVHNRVVFAEHRLDSMVKINFYYWYYPHLLASINGTIAPDEQRYLQKNVPLNEVGPLLARDVCMYPGKAFMALAKNMFKTLMGLYTSNIKLLVDDQFVAGCLSFFRLKGSVWECAWGYIADNTQHAWIKILGCVETILLLVRYVLMCVGLWALCVRRRWWELAFIVLYLGYFIGITGHDGCARFRMMIDMVILALAAGGIVSLLSLWSRRPLVRDVK
jgi:hypothetical protein